MQIHISAVTQVIGISVSNRIHDTLFTQVQITYPHILEIPLEVKGKGNLQLKRTTTKVVLVNETPTGNMMSNQIKGPADTRAKTHLLIY